MSSIAQSTQRLGWDLLSHISDLDHPQTVTALSPTSITTVLAMLTGAADPTRRASLCAKLGVPDPSELPTLLADTLSRLSPKTADAVVTTANAAFVDQTVELYPAYADFLTALDASVKQYPSLAGAVGEINAWISDSTRGHINNMLTDAALRQVHVVLVNALSFKGTWATKFDRSDTKERQPFYVSGSEEGQRGQVDMMFLRGKHVHTAKGTGFTAIRLPYTAGDMSLAAYLPNEGVPLRDVAREVSTGEGPAAGLTFRRKKYAEFGFPRFDAQTELDLLSDLQGIGLDVAGDYPELGAGQSRLGGMIHRSVLKVNEEGTEAAAATVAMMVRSIQPRQERLVFDRPFLFEIVDGETGMPVMCGVFSVAATS